MKWQNKNIFYYKLAQKNIFYYKLAQEKNVAMKWQNKNFIKLSLFNC